MATEMVKGKEMGFELGTVKGKEGVVATVVIRDEMGVGMVMVMPWAVGL